MLKNLILNQITLCADGSIGIQWLKQVLDPDTGEVLSSEPHRSVVDFDGDVDAQVDAVKADLDARGYRMVGNKMKQLIKKIDAIGKADAEITARRQAKIDLKAAAEAAKAAQGE